MNRSAARLRPDKSAALEALREKAKTVTIKPEAFNDVTSAAAKHEDVTRVWLLFENSLYLCTQTMKTAAHVCHSGRKPDPGSNRQFDHLRMLSRITRSNVKSAPCSTLIKARPGISM